jgi:hypothetical protein
MKYKLSWLLPLILLTSVTAFTQSAEKPARALHNNDVLLMVEQGMKPDDIVARIVSSPCQFDTFPPVIQDLKQRGVPDSVLAAMKRVPYGPSAGSVEALHPEIPATRAVQIPAGTIISIEVPKAISSANVRKGSLITFLVSRRVTVDETLAIDRGAKVNGRIIKRKRPGLFGRGGSLEFALENVVAVDGTRVPIQLSKDVKGDNHTTAVAAGAIITGAIIFPYTAPVGLIWGLKKGDEAVLEQGTRLAAVVRKNHEVAGLPTERKPIYHPVNSLNKRSAAPTGGLGPSNRSFRPTSIRQR